MALTPQNTLCIYVHFILLLYYKSLIEDYKLKKNYKGYASDKINKKIAEKQKLKINSLFPERFITEIQKPATINKRANRKKHLSIEIKVQDFTLLSKNHYL